MPLIVDNDKILNDDAICGVGGQQQQLTTKNWKFLADKKTHTPNTKKILEWRRSKFVNDEAEAARVVPLLQADRKRIFSQDHFNGVPKNAQAQRSK